MMTEKLEALLKQEKLPYYKEDGEIFIEMPEDWEFASDMLISTETQEQYNLVSINVVLDFEEFQINDLQMLQLVNTLNKLSLFGSCRLIESGNIMYSYTMFFDKEFSSEAQNLFKIMFGVNTHFLNVIQPEVLAVLEGEKNMEDLMKIEI